VADGPPLITFTLEPFLLRIGDIARAAPSQVNAPEGLFTEDVGVVLGVRGSDGIIADVGRGQQAATSHHADFPVQYLLTHLILQGINESASSCVDNNIVNCVIVSNRNEVVTLIRLYVLASECGRPLFESFAARLVPRLSVICELFESISIRVMVSTEPAAQIVKSSIIPSTSLVIEVSSIIVEVLE
jgi:hypothetical protein